MPRGWRCDRYAFDREQNLYVGDRSGTIFKIAPDRQIFVLRRSTQHLAYHLAFARMATYS